MSHPAHLKYTMSALLILGGLALMGAASGPGTKAAAPAGRFPLIGETAPAFDAETTQGPIRFPQDFEGSWVVLFSHPADFTPVCTTEFMAFATMEDQFEAIGCRLVGLSIDSNYSHIAWLRTIQRIEYKGMKDVGVRFPVIADVKIDVARKYGMVHPASSGTETVRAVFVIDPKATVRSVLYYPASAGRNLDEVLRLVVALQTGDAHNVATPANWMPGEDVIVPPPGSCGTAAQRIAQAGRDYTCHDWFLCTKPLPKETLSLPPMWRD